MAPLSRAAARQPDSAQAPHASASPVQPPAASAPGLACIPPPPPAVPRGGSPSSSPVGGAWSPVAWAERLASVPQRALWNSATGLWSEGGEGG